MARRARQALLAAKVDPALFEQIRRWQEQKGYSTMSPAVRDVVEAGIAALRIGPGLPRRPSRDRGYEDGLNQGLHAFKTALSEAVEKAFRVKR